MITYLLEKYDTEHKISFEKLEDRMLQTQWLFFQAAGQACVCHCIISLALLARLTSFRGLTQSILRSSGVFQVLQPREDPSRHRTLREGNPPRARCPGWCPGQEAVARRGQVQRC